MIARRLFSVLCLSVLCLAAGSPVLALANRVFVSARSGNDSNACDNVNTPCQTFAGATLQLSPDGALIVLDSGGYGPVTITKGMTIQAAAGVTAFIHPPSFGDAITVNTSGTVTLRGLVLNGEGNYGIAVSNVGTLNVENCFISRFVYGIRMLSGGRLNVKGTDIKASGGGVFITNSAGVVRASVDHCRLDGNFGFGYAAESESPGSSTTTATSSTANNNDGSGWVMGAGTGLDVLNLEFCTGSENGQQGLASFSFNNLSVGRYSNCVFANNSEYGVLREDPGTLESRGNNTITGNGLGPTLGVIGTFPPM